MSFFDFSEKKISDRYVRTTLKTVIEKNLRPSSAPQYPYVVIDNIFPNKIYQAIAQEFRSSLNKGLALTKNKDFFSRFCKSDTHTYTPSPHLQSLGIFFTHEWLDFIAHFFPHVKRTNNTILTFHHRPIKSRENPSWNGMAYGAFKNDPLPNGVNAWYRQCKHTQDPTLWDPEDTFHEVRSIAIIYFLNNESWENHGGGEVTLYGKNGIAPSVFAPINNRMLAFEVTPDSFHEFKKNLRNEENYIVQWLFEKPEETFKKYDKKSITSWQKRKREIFQKNNPINQNALLSHYPRKALKTILLIGCGGRLGTAFVERYAKQYHIIGVARKIPKNQSLLYDFIQADASSEWETIIKTAIDRHNSIDILINNAASYNYTPLLKKKIPDFITQLQINLVAPFALSQELLLRNWLRFTPEANRQHNHLIINIGSVSGTRVIKNLKQGVYSATKAALHMLTLHMAAEWEMHGIHVNAIAFHGFKQHTSPETIATAIDNCIKNRNANGVIYLVSDVKTEVFTGLS